MRARETHTHRERERERGGGRQAGRERGRERKRKKKKKKRKRHRERERERELRHRKPESIVCGETSLVLIAPPTVRRRVPLRVRAVPGVDGDQNGARSLAIGTRCGYLEGDG